MAKHLRFSILDYVLFGLTLVLSGAIGIFYATRKHEYTTGGGKLPFLPTAISLMASFVSGISLLSFPAEIYAFGTTMCWNTIGACVAVVITAFVLIPPIYAVKGLSMYRYLEERFDCKILRYYGSILFTITTLIWDSVALYAPSIALAGVTGVPVWILNISVGLICTLYTAVGGLQAVVWTDTFQALIMYGGLIAVSIKGTLAVGGIGSVYDLSEKHGRLAGFLNVDPNPLQYMTVWTAFSGGCMIWIGHFGGNQLSVQRYRSMPTVRSAQFVLLLNIPVLMSIYFLIYYMSLVMFAYYSGCDPIKNGDIKTKDQITVFFMLDVFSDVYGLPGLMLASICSATLSTISSGIHALATIALEDFVKPFRPDISSAKANLVVKIIALCYGIVITAMSFVCEPLGGVFAAFMKAFGAMDGPLVGILLLGVLIPWANWIGGLSGVIAGIIASMFFFIGGLVNGVPYATLPTSTDKCENNSTNVTNSLITVSSTAPNIVRESHGIYQLSYLLYPVLGMIFVILIGSVVSIITKGGRVRREKPHLLFNCKNRDSVATTKC